MRHNHVRQSMRQGKPFRETIVFIAILFPGSTKGCDVVKDTLRKNKITKLLWLDSWYWASSNAIS